MKLQDLTTRGWVLMHALVLVVALPGLRVKAAGVQQEIPPAFGPYIQLKAGDFAGSESFKPGQRIVGTYYFYWYDNASRSHIIDGDGTDALTDHPPALEDFSYKSVQWHQQELDDMVAAGIDVVLPVFWGAPSEQSDKAHLHWSYAGLPPLVQAREALVRAGKRPPRIGLFYDTSTLQYNQWHEHIDLTTDYGRRWFYATVRDFFSMIPPRHWAMIDGHPIVLLYSAAFAEDHDQSVIDFTKEQFARDFGGRTPYIAPEVSWHVRADNVVAWGGALGLKNPGIASVGPGYDHSAVPGRAPLIVERRGGKFYEENWLKLLRNPSDFVMVETWNEFHEGTDVCASQEYGRQYIDLTRKFADLFKRGWVPPWPAGPFTGAKSLRIQLGTAAQTNGLELLTNDDGRTHPADIGGRAALAIERSPNRGCYVYFAIDDSFKWTNRMDVTVDVQYFDAAPGTLGLEFDGSDRAAPFAGAYTRNEKSVELKGSRQWRSAQFMLHDARFAHSQNAGADFRLVVQAPEFYVGSIELRR